MGTPEFAVPSLDILLEHNYDVVGVVTATDKIGGRGRSQLIESDVKKFAKSKQLNILQPANLKSPEFISTLKSLQADLQVVVAFRMLPEVVWNMPALGTMNLHGSLLPKYRGAAPINWAIINGDDTTGVTTFFLQHEIDTGKILLQNKINIEKEDTAGTLHDKMKIIGAQTVLSSVKLIESNQYLLYPQVDGDASSAPKIFHEDCKINFDQKSDYVFNFIRGLSPHPCAWAKWNDLNLKIYAVKPEQHSHQLKPGTFSTDKKSFAKITTSDGYVSIEELQLEGRKRMDIKSFLNGYKDEFPTDVLC
ncbi:MAG: methionyl-tRNA formyltransferase [Saprospiraceae bacterium]|nr:methionyl-tRNA formyltransferase [Saprospiraceae bacterium]